MDVITKHCSQSALVSENCCDVDKCHRIRLSGSSFCHVHKCHYRDSTSFCTNGCIVGLIFCDEHKDMTSDETDCEMCEFEDCDNPAQFGYEYCESHLCVFPTCAKSHRIHKSSYKEKREYCDDHRCSIGRCEKLKLDDYDVCSNHICQYDGCTNVPTYGKNWYDQSFCGSLYCEKHRCKECELMRDAGTEYCHRHRCKYPECNMASIHNGNGCEIHKCPHITLNAGGCNYECPNVICVGGKFCKVHTCKYEGCFGEAVCTFCEKHECKFPDCHSNSIKDCPSCEIHKCAIRGCQNVVIGDCYNRSKYCTDHACMYYEEPCHIRCTHIRMDGKDYCVTHKCEKCDDCISEYQTGACLKHRCCHLSDSEYRCTKTIGDHDKYCYDHYCSGCGKEKKLGKPSCGLDCTSELHSKMYKIYKMFGCHRSFNIFLRYGKIHVCIGYGYCRDEEFHCINWMGLDICVINDVGLCEVDGCKNLTFFSTKCYSHNHECKEDAELDDSDD